MFSSPAALVRLGCGDAKYEGARVVGGLGGGDGCNCQRDAIVYSLRADKMICKRGERGPRSVGVDEVRMSGCMSKGGEDWV
jgi:hypothetical protein